MSDLVFVAGVGMTPFGRHPDKSLFDLSGAAIAAALADAGLTPADIGAAYYAGATNGSLQGQTCIPGPIALRRAGFAGIPVFTVENACVSGSEKGAGPRLLDRRRQGGPAQSFALLGADDEL